MEQTNTTPETVKVKFENGKIMEATVSLNSRGFYTMRVKIYGSWLSAGEIDGDTLKRAAASDKPIIL
jgi:hypothetical protein